MKAKKEPLLLNLKRSSLKTAFLLEKTLFYSVLLFLPTQLGKHFWPDFSYILGIRVDYLSPTLYITDILIFFLLLFFFVRLLGTKGFNFKLNQWGFIFFSLIVITGIIQAKNPLAGWYGLLKLTEFGLFGLYVSKQRLSLSMLGILFAGGVFLESSLAIVQFLQQGSVGGIFYLLGERAFSSETPGVANASLGGQLVLRPYGTFPHPNVLSCYLLFGLVFILASLLSKGKLYLTEKAAYLVVLFLGTVAIVLAMSRVGVLLWFLIALYLFLKKKGWVFLLMILIPLFLILSSYIRFRFFPIDFTDSSLVGRVSLFQSALAMFWAQPVLGVGLKNFLVNLPLFQSQTPVSGLQPVHNIYLLTISETGILGFGFFLWFLVKTYQRVRKTNLLFALFSLVLVFGFFDHYFFTLQQGQLLFAFVLGLCWARRNKL